MLSCASFSVNLQLLLILLHVVQTATPSVTASSTVALLLLMVEHLGSRRGKHRVFVIVVHISIIVRVHIVHVVIRCDVSVSTTHNASWHRWR